LEKKGGLGMVVNYLEVAEEIVRRYRNGNGGRSKDFKAALYAVLDEYGIKGKERSVCIKKITSMLGRRGGIVSQIKRKNKKEKRNYAAILQEARLAMMCEEAEEMARERNDHLLSDL
jgi:hypothetical protein